MTECLKDDEHFKKTDFKKVKMPIKGKKSI